MEIADALAAVRRNHQAVLVTMKRDGKPQLSNVLAGVGDDDLIRASITTSRAKYANLRRTPWAAVHVDGDSFWSYAVVEGDVSLSEVAADPHDAATDELVGLYRSLAGEHDDWEDYRAAMVRDRRVLLQLDLTRAGPDVAG
jgi:PPOX class probable F420-dependent enzyme